MPQQESRVKKSLLNARVNLIFYFLTLILSFFSRKIFLDTLGADFVGLTGTLQNLLGFLNLAELGIGSAIGYVLYKPLFEHDEGKINEIISVFGYLYRWIGFIILGAGIALACFLPLIFPNTEFEMGIIFFAYFSFLASSLIGYFANYKQTLLGADQKNYVVTAYFQTATIIKTLIQMASAYYTGSYYLWVAIELTFGIIYSFILNWKINQVYPWLRSEVRQGKRLFKKYPEVMKYTKQLFVHRISAFAQFQMTPILTYAFVSLQTVAYYGNYTIITDKLNLLISNFLNSTGAGVGNLIAEGDKSKIYRVYWELMSIRFWIGGVIIFAMSQLLPSFISLWLGQQYILSDLVLYLLLIIFFINISRGATEQFLYGYGLFYDTW
ncbi:lipopolysaccharide biosynthesis protein, partial [Barnesiella intestinihominis]|uniref:lipopolysaccharide biosynthesis protein n=1 Tax=Barnesiella intestinihominis TaxID=487174 RepID=UPI003AB2DE07